MKKFNELNAGQKSKALVFIEDMLRGFMKDPDVTIHFDKTPTDKEIKDHVKQIAINSVYDDNGNVLMEESLGAGV